MKIDMIAVRQQAEIELANEKFAAAVFREKLRLQTRKPLLHRIFPFRINITKR